MHSSDRELSLHAGGEGLHSQDTGLKLVFAEDDDRRAVLSAASKDFFSGVAIAQLDAKPCAAQFAGQNQGSGVEASPGEQ